MADETVKTDKKAKAQEQTGVFSDAQKERLKAISAERKRRRGLSEPNSTSSETETFDETVAVHADLLAKYPEPWTEENLGVEGYAEVALVGGFFDPLDYGGRPPLDPARKPDDPVLAARINSDRVRTEKALRKAIASGKNFRA